MALMALPTGIRFEGAYVEVFSVRDGATRTIEIRERANVLSPTQEKWGPVTKKDKAKNVGQVAKGKVKTAAGRTTGDDKLESDGKADQMKGNIKQAGEKFKDAFKK
jgi:uncharacterized protein YjbJ (UPF0337 family)